MKITRSLLKNKSRLRAAYVGGAQSVIDNMWAALRGDSCGANFVLVDDSPVLLDIDKLCDRLLALGRRERELLPMLLWCPECGERHVDKGAFATKPHHTHACQHCGHCWRPAVVATVGVQYLPGFKDPA